MITFATLAERVKLARGAGAADDHELARIVSATVIELGLVISEATGEIVGLAPRGTSWTPPRVVRHVMPRKRR